MYVSVPPPICLAIYVGLPMQLEKRGIYLCPPRPSAPAAFYQQTVLSFTVPSELLKQDMKLGRRRGAIMPLDPFGVFFPSMHLNNTELISDSGFINNCVIL